MHAPGVGSQHAGAGEQAAQRLDQHPDNRVHIGIDSRTRKNRAQTGANRTTVPSRVSATASSFCFFRQSAEAPTDGCPWETAMQRKDSPPAWPPKLQRWSWGTNA